MQTPRPKGRHDEPYTRGGCLSVRIWPSGVSGAASTRDGIFWHTRPRAPPEQIITEKETFCNLGDLTALSLALKKVHCSPAGPHSSGGGGQCGGTAAGTC